MPENRFFPPEGLRPAVLCSVPQLSAARETGDILEAPVTRCDAAGTLYLQLGAVSGRIPREEAVAPWISGADREIAVLSRVGRQTCFRVTDLQEENGEPVALLSRRLAQEDAMAYFLEQLKPGMILLCRVTRTERFGAFLDIGCGIIALLPVERISVARISHAGDRFREGQLIRAAVWNIDRERRRITMTHRELLGTWQENASRFHPGDTVPGIVRSVQSYGVFIELAPNLSGLADAGDILEPGQRVSVYIRSIRPENMKIKLQIVQKLPPQAVRPLAYQITEGRLTHWRYAPESCPDQRAVTDFTAAAP